MAKIVKIKKIPKVLSEQWGELNPNLDRTVYKLNDYRYIVFEKEESFGRHIVSFHCEKENDCDKLYSIKVDNDPTFNCQIGLIGGIETIIEDFTHDEFYDIFKLISDTIIGKNLILIDIDIDYIKDIKDSQLDIFETLDFVSTNDSERAFLLISKP